MAEPKCEPVMVLRRGREEPLYVLALPRATPAEDYSSVLACVDARFLVYLVEILCGSVCLASSRYCPSSICASALVMYRCGVQFPKLGIGRHCEETMLTNPDRTVLGVGFNRAQAEMLVERLKFVGGLFPAETRKDISTNVFSLSLPARQCREVLFWTRLLLCLQTLEALPNFERILAGLSICFFDARDP